MPNNKQLLQLNEVIYPRPLKYFGVHAQVITIIGLFVLHTLLAFNSYDTTGEIFGYPFFSNVIFTAPIYEELIFRGLLLTALTRFYSIKNVVVISSIIFGLWHLKNIFYYPTDMLIHQIAYAGIIIGPILALITIKTKNVWLSVIFHYLNNIIAPFTRILF